MTTPDLDALTRVRDALNGLADALRSGQPDAVLSAERPLADAVAALSLSGGRASANAVDLGARLLETRLSLHRCRALGDASAALIGHMFPAETSYGPTGARETRAQAGPSVETRV